MSSKNNKIAYGLAKGMGYEVAGKNPTEVWKLVNENCDTMRMTLDEAIDKFVPREQNALVEKDESNLPKMSKVTPNTNAANPTSSTSSFPTVMLSDAQIEQIKNEYSNSVNSEIEDFVDKYRRGEYCKKIYLSDLSEEEAKEIKNVTGIDVTNYKRTLTMGSLQHIDSGHGINGKSDQSMKDAKDIARMEYTLKNYDSVIGVSKEKIHTNIKNSDGSRSMVVRYMKRINGYYYVVEAIPDNKAKELVIISAFKNKTKLQ